MTTTIGSWKGLTGEDDLSSLLNTLSPLSILLLDTSNSFTAQILTSGQLLIGSTGSLPVASSITGSGNLIVTNGPGSIGLDTVQGIQTTSSPVFTGLTLSGLGSGLVSTATGVLQGTTIANANGCNASFLGSTLTFTMTQDLSAATGSPTFVGMSVSGLTVSMPVKTNAAKQLVSSLISLVTDVTGVLPIANGGTASGTALGNGCFMWSAGGAIVEATALLNGQIFIGSSGAAPVAGTLTGTALQIIVTNGVGSIVLSLPQNIDKTSTPIFANIIDNGLTPTTLLACDGSRQLQSVTISNANGCSLSFTGSTLTCTMSQDLRVTASPTFANLIDSGLTATTLLAANGSKQLQSVTISNGNGCLFSFAGSTLTCTMSQDVSTSGSPSFTNIIDSGLTATTLVASNGSKQLQSVTISNGNGCAASFSGSTLTCTMSQDVSTSGSPTFSGLTCNLLLQLVSTNISGKLIGTSFASTNGVSVSLSGGALIVSTSQDLQVSASPTFVSVSCSNIVGVALGEYGTGVDGVVTISVNTTLTRDMYYAALTVNTGIVLNAAGFRVFVKGLLTLSGTGIISNDGSVGANAAANVAGNGGAGAVTGTVGGGAAGGAGSISGSGATAGGAGTNSLGSAGGQGGSVGAHAAGGGVTAVVAGNGGVNVVTALPSALIGRDLALNVLTGGAGGGGGTGSGGVAGGGGGGGGGVVIVAANTVAGTGSITAKGGNGGWNTDDWSNGGGGGGGCVVLVTSTITVGVTLSAAGGSGTEGIYIYPGSAGSAGVTITIIH